MSSLDPKLADIAKDLGIDTSAKATPEQQARIEALTLAVGVLNEGKVCYSLFASPDTPSEEMKIMASHRLSYASSLKTIGKETPLTRHAILFAALKTLSVGLKGMLVVVGQDGTPLVAFDNGKTNRIEKDAKTVTA